MNLHTENTNTPLESDSPDLVAIKSKMKATWEDGDYAGFSDYMSDGAVEILENWAIPVGQRLLDIGCGSGQSAIPAARFGHQVTGVDIAENLIAHARHRAHEEGLDATFDVGDAEDLPYQDDSFDVVITMIGAMFAPRPDKVATELARVIRSGGRLYMVNWTPDSMPARMFKCIASFVPPPPGFIPPVLWGDEKTVHSRLKKNFTDITLHRKVYPQWHYPFDAAGVVELFCTCFGPVKRAFESVDNDNRKKLCKALEHIYSDNGVMNGDKFTITGGEYLEVIATRQ